MARVERVGSAQRFETREPGIVSRHLLSFGVHYDPSRVAIGPLRALNDIVLDPEAGFEAHQHRDVEIVTWVVEGALAHEDSTGQHGVVGAGKAQRLSAGAGVTHVERNAEREVPTRFVQMWLQPDVADDADAPAAEPDYADADVAAGVLQAGWVRVASGQTAGGDRGDALMSLRCRGASLLATRLGAGERRELATAGRALVYLTRGRAEAVVDAEPTVSLADGDALHIEDDATLTITSEEPCEALVWRLP